MHKNTSSTHYKALENQAQTIRQMERKAKQAAAEAERERVEAEEAKRLAKEAANKAEQERLEREAAEQRMKKMIAEK